LGKLDGDRKIATSDEIEWWLWLHGHFIYQLLGATNMNNISKLTVSQLESVSIKLTTNILYFIVK
jgi:hypothetical protein